MTDVQPPPDAEREYDAPTGGAHVASPPPPGPPPPPPPSPYGSALQPASNLNWSAEHKVRSPVNVWLLAIVTFGIYALVWYYKVNRELRDFDPAIDVKPGLAALALCVPIANFISVYHTGKRIAQAQQDAGLPATCSGGVGLLLGFVFGLYPLYYQGHLNKIWEAGR